MGLMVYYLLAVLAIGCAFCGLSVLVDRLLRRPMERRWRR